MRLLLDKKLCTIYPGQAPIVRRLVRGMAKLPTQRLVPARLYLRFAEQDALFAVTPVCLASYLRIKGERRSSRPHPLRSNAAVRALALA